MLSVQLCSALSMHEMTKVGPAGVAWLRLSIGSIIFLVLVRPPLRALRGRDLPIVFGLGATIGLQTILFLAAIQRIPLGTSVAVEFLGPMTVAALLSHRMRALIWPALALLGVVLLTEPWRGNVSVAGLSFAALAAVGWAVYILLTQQLGDRFGGLGGLSLTIPIAALTAAIIGIPQAAGHLTIGVVATSAGLAVLLPVLPYSLELLALRRMTHHAFGTLMALEPGFAVCIGLLILHQQPSAFKLVGLLLVITAGTAAQLGGLRQVTDT
ncbi:EamA family transporter [Ferrimicrobium acidiphilum]|uniref:EamA family transporter n=1 Tax=Ferrimicrobium acidiphilum TaxID=121039 RepID=UPI003C6CD43D